MTLKTEILKYIVINGEEGAQPKLAHGHTWTHVGEGVGEERSELPRGWSFEIR